jgi:uncharacterized protein (TIGR00251 family)
LPAPPADTLTAHTTRDGALRFEVVARPRSRQSRVAGVRQGALVVQLAAPPVDGAANAELVATLAGVLGVARRDVAIVRGDASRNKLVEVRGITEPELRARLLGGAAGSPDPR